MAQRTWLDDLTWEAVTVHTVNGGPTYRGLKQAVYPDGILLANAAVVEETGLVFLNEPLFVPREQVHALQPVSG